MNMKQIKSNEFKKEVLESSIPVLVDFAASWCGPCKMMGPVLEQLSAEYEGRVIIGKCDVDGNNDIVAQYRVRNIPTVLFIKNGELLDKLVGANPKSAFVEKIEKYL